MTSRRFSASQLSEQLELVGFDIFTAITIVTIDVDIDFFARYVLILSEAHFTAYLGGSK